MPGVRAVGVERADAGRAPAEGGGLEARQPVMAPDEEALIAVLGAAALGALADDFLLRPSSWRCLRRYPSY